MALLRLGFNVGLHNISLLPQKLRRDFDWSGYSIGPHANTVSVKITSEALLQGLLSSIIKVCDFLRKDLYRAQPQREIISPEVN